MCRSFSLYFQSLSSFNPKDYRRKMTVANYAFQIEFCTEIVVFLIFVD